MFSWFGSSETQPLLFANANDQTNQHHSLYSTPQNWPTNTKHFDVSKTLVRGSICT